MSTDTLVDAVALREEVKDKYRDVALDPHGEFHFHTGRPLAKRLGYDDTMVGPSGQVIGIDMTQEMLDKSRSTAQAMGLDQVEFREGIVEEMPVADGQVDVVISNGVINLCADKEGVFSEIWRILRPGGVLQFADIANGQPVPEAAVSNIDLWTA
jgi:SAM-dependent methyltransferase